MYQLNMFFVLIQRRVEEGTILYVGEVSIHGSFDHEYHIKAQISTCCTVGGNVNCDT